MYKIIISLFVIIASGCASTDNSVKPVVACGVTMQFTINPERELTEFKIHEPRCSDKTITPKLSAAWKKTACAQITISQNPTYNKGEPAKPLYYNFYYRPSRPDVLYPNVNSGGSQNDPVIYVQDSILESKSKICDGELDA